MCLRICRASSTFFGTQIPNLLEVFQYLLTIFPIILSRFFATSLNHQWKYGFHSILSSIAYFFRLWSILCLYILQWNPWCWYILPLHFNFPSIYGLIAYIFPISWLDEPTTDLDLISIRLVVGYLYQWLEVAAFVINLWEHFCQKFISIQFMIRTAIEFHFLLMSVNKFVCLVDTYSIPIDTLPVLYYFSEPWVSWTIRKLNFSTNEPI